MENVKMFFAGQAKDGACTNNQQTGLGLFAGRSLQTGNGLTNGAARNSSSQMTNHYEAKRKDSDSYFYIMWRS